jgi:hypothetical protein
VLWIDTIPVRKRHILNTYRDKTYLYLFKPYGDQAKLGTVSIGRYKVLGKESGFNPCSIEKSCSN